MLKKPILFIIGVQGSGKTSAAKLIAHAVNGIFYDGDDAIPSDSEIKKRLDQGLTIFPNQVDEFICNHLLSAVKNEREKASSQEKILIVSQGLFFNKHRVLLQNELGGDIYFIVIETTPELQTQQITARGIAQGKSTAYIDQEIKSAMISNPYFEKPDASIKAFYLLYFGKGKDKDFLENFKKLPFCRDLCNGKHPD